MLEAVIKTPFCIWLFPPSRATPFFRDIYFGENLRKKSIILKPKGLTFWGFFLSGILNSFFISLFDEQGLIRKLVLSIQSCFSIAANNSSKLFSEVFPAVSKTIRSSVHS